MKQALLDEVFASVQGEGASVGQRHIFVRFLGCGLGCRYCDTPAAANVMTGADVTPCRAQRQPDMPDREDVPNPIAPALLSALCGRLAVPSRSRPVISLTGGEPLLQADFLRAWLPAVRDRYRIHLETAGILHDALRLLTDLVDMVSMDIKLPSATGKGAFWDEHRAFLEAAGDAEISLKVVVTRDTGRDDVAAAARLLAASGREAPFIIQPCSGVLAPAPDEIMALQTMLLPVLSDVRVIPQVHRMLNVP